MAPLCSGCTKKKFHRLYKDLYMICLSMNILVFSESANSLIQQVLLSKSAIQLLPIAEIVSCAFYKFLEQSIKLLIFIFLWAVLNLNKIHEKAWHSIHSLQNFSNRPSKASPIIFLSILKGTFSWSFRLCLWFNVFGLKIFWELINICNLQ